MTMNRKRKAPPLPAWATLSQPEQRDQYGGDESTLPEEDAYLRTCAYRAAHQFLERALDRALDTALARSTTDDNGTSCATLLAELLKTSTTAAETSSASVESTTVVDDIYAPFVIPVHDEDEDTGPQRFPDALPLLAVEGPFAAADRKLWVQHLMQTIIAQQYPPEQVVLWTTAEAWTEQESEQAKDTIVFIHNDATSFLYTYQLSDVLQSLSGRVKAVVLLLPAGFRRPILWRCSTDLDVRKGVLPTSEAVLDCFWENIKDFCIPLGDMQDLVASFYNIHRSIVAVVQDLQRRCLWQLQTAGSFWLALPLLPPSCKIRANSFLFDTRYRERDAVKEWLIASETRRIQASVALPIRRKLWEWTEDHRSAFLLDQTRASPSTAQTSLDTAQRRELIALLFEVVRNPTQLTTAFESTGLPSRVAVPAVASIRDAVVETSQKLVVVIDQCTYVTQLEQYLFPLIRAFTHTASLSPLADNTSSLPTQPHQPRQALVQALLSLDSQENVVELGIPGCLYSIVLDQYSITETDWFQSFLERYEGEEGKTDAALFRLFGAGVRHLQACGLVRSRKTPKHTIFEKAATVWCGGEEG